MLTETKICTRCNEVKPLTAFNKKTGNKFHSHCKECVAITRRIYYESNSNKVKKRVRSYKNSNKHMVNADRAKRRAAKLEATPDWLTDEQLNEIKNIYWLAQDLKKITGEDYHVDHIIPLQGEEVRGLHVPWNLQILPADINLSKGNRIEDGSTET